MKGDISDPVVALLHGVHHTLACIARVLQGIVVVAHAVEIDLVPTTIITSTTPRIWALALGLSR